MTTVAASVAVICVVALTNTVALSEAAGASIGAGPVVVPFSGVAPSATPLPDTDVPPSAPVAEVVPAPAPEIVTPRQAVPPAPPVPPVPPAQPAQPPAGGAQTPSEDEVIAGAEAAGSWESAREWAIRLGWSEARIDAWIAKLERSRVPGASAPDSSTDMTQEQSLVTGSLQERPAQAGADADRRSTKPGGGEKKDRSRDSPDRRDR